MQHEFFAWAEAQGERYEFDGVGPLAMPGGTARHNCIVVNLLTELRTRLTGKPCRPLGPDSGIVTLGTTVRYPDALVTCTPFSGDARVIDGTVVVFEA